MDEQKKQGVTRENKGNGIKRGTKWNRGTRENKGNKR